MCTQVLPEQVRVFLIGPAQVSLTLITQTVTHGCEVVEMTVITSLLSFSDYPTVNTNIICKQNNRQIHL